MILSKSFLIQQAEKRNISEYGTKREQILYENVEFHYNDWTGKNKRKLKRGFKTRKEALEWEQKFRLSQANSLEVNFGEFYKMYEEDLKPKLKLNTWKTKETVNILMLESHRSNASEPPAILTLRSHHNHNI